MCSPERFKQIAFLTTHFSHLSLRKIPVYQLSGFGQIGLVIVTNRTLINGGDLVVMMIGGQYIFNTETDEGDHCIRQIATNLAPRRSSFCQVLSSSFWETLKLDIQLNFLFDDVFSTKL